MEKLKEIIRELIKKELDEATTTGNIEGYETPNAFTGGPGKGKKKKKEERNSFYVKWLQISHYLYPGYYFNNAYFIKLLS